MNFIDIAREVLKIESDELLLARSKIGENFNEATELISTIKGKLIITGVGKSGLVGAKMAATFASTGTSSFFLHPTEAMHGDLGMISKGDAVLAISYSGESDELIKIIPHIKRFEIPLIAMAGFKDSTLGKNCDIFIDVNVQKEACPLNAAPTSSTTLTMAMGDALAVCLMKKRDFKKEDFASFHPGGSLGKRLFLKISDLLRVENLPIVSRETILKDVLITLSEGRLGNVVLVDEEQKVVGVFSDGDLRRAVMRNDFSLDDKVEKYATRNPKTIDDKNILASDALKIIENYKIQLLLVTNKNREIEGLIHIHDLIEAGINEPKKNEPIETVRLNKFLSHNTRYSRREADELIKAGKVKIGQKVVAELSTVVSSEDKVFVDGVFIKEKKNESTVIVYNKLKGELVTKKDPMGRKTIYDTLPDGFKHFIPVGRLDFASEGLILLTDSPDIATALMHSELERMYKVKIKGNITNTIKQAMESGIEIIGSKKGAHRENKIENISFAPFVAFSILKDSPTFSKLKIILSEGLNRELRRFFAHFDREVVDLKRLEYGGISLNNLPSGKWRFLSKNEYKSLHSYMKDNKNQ